MNQQFFDYEQSRENRNQAIDAVENSRPDWAARFELAILSVADQGRWFSSDDVLRQHPDLEACPEKRVIGAAIRRLANAGQIEGGSYVSSNRKSSHARPKRTWRKAK